MTELEAAVIRRRLLAMRELLTHLSTLGPVTDDDLRGDIGLRLQVSMAIAQLITLASEINAHVVRQETGTAPTDLRSGFTAMARHGWIDETLADGLRDAPGMRNVIIHEYVEVDLARVAAAVPATVARFSDYVREVAGRLPEA